MSRAGRSDGRALRCLRRGCRCADGCSSVWGAAIDSTQQQQERQRQQESKARRTGGSVWERTTAAARQIRARGWYYQVWAEAVVKLGEALAGPEGGRKCGAVERCVWRIWTQETHSPVHADQDVRGEAPSPSTGEQQPWKVTLGARMQRCKDATQPIAAMQAGCAGPTFAHLAGQRVCGRALADRYRRGTSAAYRGYRWIKPHLQPARELCICMLRPLVHVCSHRLPAAHLSLSLLLPIAALCPHRTLYLACLPACLPAAVFSETLAAFRHSLAMTSASSPPAGHYGIEPPLVSSARSRLALWCSTRQPHSAWQAPVPWAANRPARATRNTSQSVRLRPRLSTRLTLLDSSAACFTQGPVEPVSGHIWFGRPSPHPWGGRSLLWALHGPQAKQTATLTP
jgi:hypothetical protein